MLAEIVSLIVLDIIGLAALSN